MGIETIVGKDIWAVISDNYEKGSYTTAITNLIQYVNEVVREKSELELDNTKLMDVAFLGQNPKLKINNLQTETEKDIQSGVGYLLKGLCLAVRNPRAHERYTDKKETADTIIQFINFVLEFVRTSKQPNLIEDWLEFVFDKNFNSTKQYAQIVLNEIPQKKRYELLVSIFRNRIRATPNTLNNLVNILMDNIKPCELHEFLDNLNKELLYCADDKGLRMFLSLFPPEKWETLIPLTKLKIEGMIEKSIEQGMMYYDEGGYDESDYKCNGQGTLSTWARRFIPYFDTKEDILRAIGNKLANKDMDERNFVTKYFNEIIFGDEVTKNNSLIYGLKQSLRYFDKSVYENLSFTCYIMEDENVIAVYGKEVDIAHKHFDDLEKGNNPSTLEAEDELPF